MVVTSSQFESMTPSGSMPAGPSYLLPSSLGRSEFHSSFLGRIKIRDRLEEKASDNCNTHHHRTAKFPKSLKWDLWTSLSYFPGTVWGSSQYRSIESVPLFVSSQQLLPRGIVAPFLPHNRGEWKPFTCPKRGRQWKKILILQCHAICCFNFHMIWNFFINIWFFVSKKTSCEDGQICTIKYPFWANYLPNHAYIPIQSS